MTLREEIEKEGYIVVPHIVPQSFCDRLVDDINSHVKDCKEKFIGDTVEMYHYQSMWDIRQYPAVHKVFRDLFGTDGLWVSIDRTNYKPPSTDFEKSGFMHWDENPNQRPRPFVVQGVIALTETTKDMGGFHCLPSLYKKLDSWIENLPYKKARYHSFYLDKGLAIYNEGPSPCWDVESIPMGVGDLLVWHSFLPHGNGTNLSNVPRYAMYVTMFPVGDARLAQERVNCWKTNSPPSGWAFPGDIRMVEQKKEPAILTSLGRRLLGSIPWSLHGGKL